MKKLAAFMILLLSFFYFTGNTEASGSQLIIINKKTNTLAFYEGGALVKTFKVATGRSNDYTPEGTFNIVNKIKNRPYYTKNIPGGDPRNPLGDRWMGLDARGTYGTTYAIHGNANENSIGKYASSGCVRMHNQEVRWLFDRVQISTTVVITRSDSNFDSIAMAHGYTVTVSSNESVTANASDSKNGWVQNGTNKYYYENGTAKKGWQTIDYKRYFFDGSGVMNTGWLSSDGRKFYLSKNGVMNTGWITVDGSKYFLDANGEMKTGWLDDGGNKYYLDQAGIMKTGWIDEGGLKYYFDTSGVMKTGWFDDGEKRYYLGPTGVMKIGWFNEGDKRYYLDNGVMKTGWLDDGGKRYYFDSAGAMKTDWIEDGGKWYYLDSTGIMKTGWINEQGKWFYINTNGILNADFTTVYNPQTNADNLNVNKTGGVNDSWKNYIQNNSVNRVTSWLKYGDNWYYLYVSKDMAEISIMDEKIGG